LSPVGDRALGVLERDNRYGFGVPAEIQTTHFPDATIYNGAISRDGRLMIVTRGSQARDAFLITNLR
jgi:hypothetical protein